MILSILSASIVLFTIGCAWWFLLNQPRELVLVPQEPRYVHYVPDILRVCATTKTIEGTQRPQEDSDRAMTSPLKVGPFKQWIIIGEWEGNDIPDDERFLVLSSSESEDEMLDLITTGEIEISKEKYRGEEN